MGLLVSLLNRRTRIIGLAPRGVHLITTYGILGPPWHSVWGLQYVRVLYWSCSYNHPQGLYMGTLTDFAVLYVFPSSWIFPGEERVNLFLLGRRVGSRPMKLKQQLESLQFRKIRVYPKTV